MNINPVGLKEAMENRKFNKGQVQFPASSLGDPFIQQMVRVIAQHKKIHPTEVIALIQEKANEVGDYAKLAPLLYGTMMKNIVESTTFKVFASEPDLPHLGPTFSNVMFHRLIRAIRADHDEFWPLRSFIDKRRLDNPQYQYVEDPLDFLSKVPSKAITTAAATPGGKFIFNLNFVQKLLDWANYKKVHGKGQKYISNGGDIPDEWSYIEFLIMHEFMHFSHDDFYYQRIIPKANNQLINWVGDFRTNYLLTKSGYTPLPFGLYNDEINYDRQKTYIEMYNLVKSEFDKLPKQKSQRGSEILDGEGDAHSPGNQEGEKGDIDGNPTVDDINQNDKQVEKEVENSKDADKNARDRQPTNDTRVANDGGGTPGTGIGGKTEVDYKAIAPRFSWAEIVRRFLANAKPKVESTYAKMHRRSIAGVEIMRQRGAGAIKPADQVSDMSDALIGFVFDTSGSMSGVIAKVYANAANLLSQPVFKKTMCVVYKFTGDYDVFKLNFATKRGGQVQSFDQQPKKLDMTADQIFSTHKSGGTIFSSGLAAQICAAQARKYNIIIFTDADIMHGDNFKNLATVIKQFPHQTFIVFDTRNTYVAFRKSTNLATANMSYFEDK